MVKLINEDKQLMKGKLLRFIFVEDEMIGKAQGCRRIDPGRGCVHDLVGIMGRYNISGHLVFLRIIDLEKQVAVIREAPFAAEALLTK